MARRTTAAKGVRKSGGTTTRKAPKVFTKEEASAMRERAREVKAGADGEEGVLAKIAAMPASDRALGKRIHAIVMANGPGLSPKLWYGMPAYARHGKVVCHFTAATKFKTRYASFAFSDQANLDQGAMWPTAFALTELTAADEETIGALVRKAVS